MPPISVIIVAINNQINGEAISPLTPGRGSSLNVINEDSVNRSITPNIIHCGTIEKYAPAAAMR